LAPWTGHSGVMKWSRLARAARSAKTGTALVLAGAALAVAGVAVLAWPEPRVSADIGSVLPNTATAVPAFPTAEPGTRLQSPPPVATAAPVEPVAPVPTGFVPERLLVESLAIDAPLVASVVDAQLSLVPPKDPAELAWWRGVRPGDGAGSVLVAGHLDSRIYGQGPLGRIVDLSPGDVAVVTGPGGVTATYAVRGVQTFPKEALPAAELFTVDGAERLVLVTCGGTFIPERRGWDSNIVAVLDPVLPAT
jgi:hypothetical protein